MIPFTLEHWLRADADTRLIILDAVLERLPSGYREHGQRSAAFPQFVHEESGVVFDALLGGRTMFGMTERRWQRAVVMNSMWNINGSLERRLALPIEPAREVTIAPALVASVTLPVPLMRSFGLDDTRVSSTGFDPTQLGLVLRSVTRLGWRAPSEAEWEFALRASCGDVGDGFTPNLQASETTSSMGARYELCCDDFFPTLAGYPSHGSRGAGHEVVRGRTEVVVRGTASTTWAEALWPGRRRLADISGHLAFRPWVSLVG